MLYSAYHSCKAGMANYGRITASSKRRICMNFGPTELIIILLIVVVLFGVGRISKIAGELGSGIRSFREGLKGEDKDKTNSPEKEEQEEKK